MERTSSANDLTEPLRKGLGSERQEVEELPRSDLERLAENSRRVVTNVLRTIERDMEDATGRMCELLLKTRPRPLVVGMSLWIAFCARIWATMRWLARSIQDRIEMASELDRDIEDVRRTLAHLEVDTWGIVFHQIKGGRFVVVPEGALAKPPQRVDECPASKLTNE